MFFPFQPLFFDIMKAVFIEVLTSLISEAILLYHSYFLDRVKFVHILQKTSLERNVIGGRFLKRWS